MILTCPECRTRYQADAAQFPTEGRKVRCARCGHVWHQSPPEPETVREPVAVELPAERVTDAAGAPASVAESSGLRGRAWGERLGILAGWLTLVVLIGLIGWTGYRFRQQIAMLWPQSSALFATFGVAVNAQGIAIDGTSYRRESEHGQPVWIVTGRLVNRSGRELVVPPVRVALTDANARELYHWTVRSPRRTLKPGQTLGFSARIPSPPPGARQVQLGFAGRE